MFLHIRVFQETQLEKSTIQHVHTRVPPAQGRVMFYVLKNRSRTEIFLRCLYLDGNIGKKLMRLMVMVYETSNSCAQSDAPFQCGIGKKNNNSYIFFVQEMVNLRSFFENRSPSLAATVV